MYGVKSTLPVVPVAIMRAFLFFVKWNRKAIAPCQVSFVWLMPFRGLAPFPWRSHPCQQITFCTRAACFFRIPHPFLHPPVVFIRPATIQCLCMLPSGFPDGSASWGKAVFLLGFLPQIWDASNASWCSPFPLCPIPAGTGRKSRKTHPFLFSAPSGFCARFYDENGFTVCQYAWQKSEGFAIMRIQCRFYLVLQLVMVCALHLP